MDGEQNPVVEAVADLAQAAESNAEAAGAVIEQVIENAEARVEEAERNAELIAAAAVEGERGRRIEQLEREQWAWQEEARELRETLEVLRMEFSTIKEQMASITTLMVADTASTDLSLSTPDQSTVAEAVTETMEVLPGNLENVVEENPVPQPPAKAKLRRWI